MKSPPRLFVLLASKAPLGVVFRRGPSNQVLLIKWDLKRDTFEPGQWLKGRVYERRCDLSPDGSMLLYFASDQRRAIASWTAISRPPYFTALALWPKGNTYGGGGIFKSDTEVLLDFQDWEELKVANGFSKPEWLAVQRLERREGWEEFSRTSPWSMRLERDGWTQIQRPEKTKDEFGARMRLELDPPIIWQKPHPLKPDDFSLQMIIQGIGGQNRPWIISEHRVIGRDGYIGLIGESEWSDWSLTGDLLFSQEGSIFRLRLVDGGFDPIEASEQVAGFTGLEFSPCKAPDEARLWPRHR